MFETCDIYVKDIYIKHTFQAKHFIKGFLWVLNDKTMDTVPYLPILYLY